MKSLLIFLILIFSWPIEIKAETYEGKVIAVKDGDTIEVLSIKKISQKIRLAEIDAPEKNQDWGQASKAVLSELIFGKVVIVEKLNLDRFGRTVAKVNRKSDGLSINLEMVKRGMAWVYTQYNKNRELPLVESKARENKIGLWSDKNPIPPWIFRREKKKKIVMVKDVALRTEKFSCKGKKLCKEMSSCAEAKYYLHYCGVKSLDGNNDKIPCNTLCLNK